MPAYHTQRLLSLLVSNFVLFFAICLPAAASAQDEPLSSEAQRTMLVIDSYNENAPWAKSVLTPVSYFVANNDSIHAEITYLNSVLITDQTEYDKVRANMVSNYANRHIDYVVFIGNLAFTLRDEIKRIWGDIPMLLVTRDLMLSPTEYYFSGYDLPLVDPEGPTLESLRPDYNFTVVHVPDLYRETIDMMVDVIPEMSELVFFSDGTYFNRNLARNVQGYLLAEYPDVKFKWVQASADNPELQYYLMTRAPKSGLLLSNWFFSQMGPLGYPQLVQGDINLLYSSTNPFFTLKSGYLNMGAVGGVFNASASMVQALNENLQYMFNGQEMRDLPFTTFPNSKVPTVRYPVFVKYGFHEADCPEDTVFLDKPQSLWDRYKWYLLVGLLVLALLIVLYSRRSANQRKQIELLSRHKQFVDNMPIPYTKAKVVYNEDMSAILDVKYTMSNQAFDDIIRENSNPQNSYLLFSPEFISDKTTEMLENGGMPVSFLHRFENSDKYYIFTLCLVDSHRKKSNQDVVDMIDIFAIDVTKRQKAEDELKLITRRLDLTIDVANLIPWEWDMTTDNMVFDAYSLFKRQRVSTLEPGQLNSAHSVVTVGEFMKLIHPEDRAVIRGLREDLFLDKIKKFTVEYRVIIAKQNQQAVEWVEVKGAIARRDEEGRPALVMGSMTLITERKEQEQAMIEAERRSVEAEAVKEKFLANISHHVRIQLNSIVGFSTLMSETNDPAKRKEFANIIQLNNDQLLKYIDDLAEESSEEILEPKLLSEIQEIKPDNAPSTEGKATEVQQNDDDRHSARPATTTPVPVRPKEAAEPAATRPGEAPLVLIAEDIEGNFLLLKHFIPKQYEIMHAWTGLEALEMFKERRPDLVLMDIGMPVMDGYKATAEIRRIDDKVPIVAVTAYTFASERDLIMSSGFDDYMSKPVSRDLILEALKRYAPLS